MLVQFEYERSKVWYGQLRDFFLGVLITIPISLLLLWTYFVMDGKQWEGIARSFNEDIL